MTNAATAAVVSPPAGGNGRDELGAARGGSSPWTVRAIVSTSGAGVGAKVLVNFAGLN